MELESRKDELMAEIVKVEKEIEVKTSELEEIRKKLNKESLEEVYDDEFKDEEELDDENEEELDDENEEDKDDDYDEEEDDSNEEEIKEKEAKLSEEVLVLQMRLVALNKQLNDVLAGQATDKFTSKED